MNIQKIRQFLIDSYKEIVIIGIWAISLLPGLIISIIKGDPLHASFIVMIIQFFASFGSLTLFGMLAQLICYSHIESTTVHDHMLEGLFIGFHAGILIWIVYAFYNIFFGYKLTADINFFIGFFGVTCIVSCILGIFFGFLSGKYRNVVKPARLS